MHPLQLPAHLSQPLVLYQQEIAIKKPLCVKCQTATLKIISRLRKRKLNGDHSMINIFFQRLLPVTCKDWITNKVKLNPENTIYY